jgi:hypothetical protein
MSTLIIKILPRGVLLGLLCLGLSCKAGVEKSNLHAEDAYKNGLRTYTSLEAKLDSLSQTPKVAPTRGAMCYEPMMRNDEYKDFVCSKCKKGTKYDIETYNEIIQAKRVLEGIKNLKLTIDDSGFCKNCSKSPTQRFKISIYYPDRKDPITSELTIMDVNIIKQFLDGSKVYTGERESKTDMKDMMPLLKRVFLGGKDE